MNVLVLTSSYPRFAGDATAPFIESTVTHVARLGHEVHLVVPEHREWAHPAVEDGVHFHPYRYSPWRSWTPWGYSQSLAAGTKLHRSLYALAPVAALSALRTCTAVARARQIDVIHAHWVIPNGPIAARAARHRDLSLVITVHGSDVAMSERSRWLGGIARRSLRGANAVTAASKHLLGRVADLDACHETLELVPLGMDVEAFHPDASAAASLRGRLRVTHDEVLVLGIGRLVKLKGFEHLIEAMARVRDRAPNVRLVVAGDGDMRRELIEHASRLGLEGRVTFVGMVQRAEVPAYFAAADVVAVPTVRHEDGFVEALGYVVHEALATGKPVVASRVGGLPEVVEDGETGYLVDERDPGALAEAILTLARDPDLRRRFGENARARALAALSWDGVAQTWVDLYQRLIDARTTAQRTA